MHIRLEKWLRSLIVCGIFVMLIIPLIVVPAMYFPADSPKGFAFRIIATLLAGAWVALVLLYNKEYRPPRSWILGAFAFFVLVTAIADMHGVDPYKSFWGNYQRMGGLLTLLDLFLYILVASSVIRSERVWRTLLQCSVAMSVIVGIYAFFEIAGITPLTLGARPLLQSPLIGTFGNPMDLATYMLLSIFTAALLWSTSSNTRSHDYKRRLLPWIYGIVIAFETVVLFLTDIRGSMLGLLVGGLTILLAFAAVKRSRTIGSIFMIVLLCVIAAGISIKVSEQTGFVQDVRSLSHLAAISPSDPTTASRLSLYGIAWHAVEERPLLGWGQENFVVPFGKYYDPSLEVEGWADRVHNIVFQVLVDSGFMGLLAYIAVCVAVMWTVWRKSTFSMLDRCVLTGLFVGYFVQDLFEFDSIVTYVVLGVVLSYIIFRSRIHEINPVHRAEKRIPSWAAPIVVALVLAVTVLVAWLITADALLANIKFREAELLESSDPQQSLQDYKLALSHWTFGSQEISQQLAEDTISMASPSVNMSSSLKQQFFTFAKEQMEVELEHSPLDAEGEFYLGVLCNNFGDYACANTALQAGHDLAPDKQSILIALSANSVALNDATSAVNYAQQAFDLYPDFTEARITYARLLILTGNISLADQLLEPLIPSGAAADPTIIDAYGTIDRPDKIIPILVPYVQANPNNTWGYLMLATAYYWNGDSADSILTLQTLSGTVPSATNVTVQLIHDIQNAPATNGAVLGIMLKAAESASR